MKEKRTGSGCVVATVVAMLLLPLLYILSSGPALWITVNVRLPATLWNVAYWPLTYARDTVPGFHSRFQWYLDLWTG
jgi:hypothetical protein